MIEEHYFQQHVFCCLNKREKGHSRGSCARAGSEELRDYMKKRVKEAGLGGANDVRVNAAGCLDRCELGPVIVIYPAGIWYHVADKHDVDEIVEQHLLGGKIVTRLQLKRRQKRL